ncbi:hypothetical protein E2562_033570, partial [Oryza meyeriana var. granulata]
DKKTVAEYEIGFNQIVRFVPHVAHDEVEKARQFRQGLKLAIRHMLGTFTITDFHSMVEQALGVEMQLMYTANLYKSTGGEQSRSQGDGKGHSGGLSHKKGKSQRHHAYRGSSTQSRTLGGTTPQYRAISKHGMGMMMAVPPSILVPVPPTHQYLLPPSDIPPVPIPQYRAFWLPHATTPSTPVVPWVPALAAPTVGASSSTSVLGVYAMPSADSIDRGDVVTGLAMQSIGEAIVKTISLQAPSGQEVIFQGSGLKYTLYALSLATRP